MKLLVLSLLCAVMLSCGERKKAGAPSERPIFTDVTEESGVHFIHEPGVDGSYFMPESLGSGVALFDYDNDGDLDIYLINGNFRDNRRKVYDQLYRQDGNFKFTDVTNGSALNDPGNGMGVAIGDIDNDDDRDVYVTNHGGDSLYTNNGDGTFTNVTVSAGITNKKWGTSAAFLDYDRDGYLDLYVANYVDFDPVITCMDRAGRQDYCGPKGFDGVADVLYHNNGNGT
ncbi:MAG: FG-GAP repeat domain-containing protein, partial [Acidobacteriota bacterium]